MCNSEHIDNCDNQWHSVSRKEQGKIIIQLFTCYALQLCIL